MCETLGPQIDRGANSLSLFLVGLLSVIDAILQLPMPDILQQVSVPADVYCALVQGNGFLRQVLDLVVAMERGVWDDVSRLSSASRISELKVSEAYIQAVQWGNQIFHVNEPILSK